MKRILSILIALLLFATSQAQIGRYPFARAVSEETSDEEGLIVGLVSYWKLDEASGAVVDSRDSNNGTNSGASPGSTGKINDAYDFAGGDYIGFGDPDNLQLGSTGAISCWIYSTNSANYRTIISKGNSITGRNGYEIYHDGFGNITGMLASGSAVAWITIGGFAINEWVHIVFTWNATTAYIYRNALSPQSGSTVVPVSDVYNLVIGESASNAGTDYFIGLIDEVGIWNRQLTGDEVTDLYNSGNGLAYPFDQ